MAVTRDDKACLSSPTVVVIGASAGGIQAVSTVLETLPTDFPAPIVVVQHRTPTARSLLVPILQRRTSLTVIDASEGDTLRPGTVYVARPDLHLTITDDGRLSYCDGRRIRHLLSSANPLFASAASIFGTGAIGVVLTGSGHDGTDGVQAVKEHGGVVIAQDEATAEQFSMPRSAIATGAVDYVLPLKDIAPALVRLVTARSRRIAEEVERP